MKKLFTIALFSAAAFVATAQRTVIFRVDMTQETVSGDGVSIAGNFQAYAGGSDWTPGAILLTDSDGNGVYETPELTFNTADEISIQWKFLNGIAWGTDETALTDVCGADNGLGGFNRMATIPAGEYWASDIYIFNTCDLSPFANTSQLSTAKSVKVSPNPVSSNAIVSFENISGDMHSVTVKTLVGQTVATYNNVYDNVSINRDGLTGGMYFVVVSNAKGEQSVVKVVVE